MPTLRDDIIEARDRVIEARKPLVNKLLKHEAWSRDQEIIALDGMDSLVSMANETLPYIPNGVVGSGGSRISASVDPAPIVPIGTKTGYATVFPNRAGVAHSKQALNLGSLCGPEYPGLPDGFDDSRPNVVLNPKTGNFDFTDVDFTGDNAGSSEREIVVRIVPLLPYGQWGDVEFTAVSTGDDNRVIAPGHDGAQRFEVRGSPFTEAVDFTLKLSGAPRSGGKDWFRIQATWFPLYPDRPDLDIGTSFETGIRFILPNTVHNQYRDAHIYSRQPNGGLNHEIVHSVDQITEHDGFLWYRGDHGWPIKIVNVHDVIGTWFVPGDNVNPGFVYDIHAHVEDGELEMQADALTPSGDRFAVMRQGHMDGWLSADRAYEITPRKL